MAMTSAKIMYDANQSKNKVHPSELLTLLDQYSSTIKILSLDCFDTLLWRKTATPADVFYESQHHAHTKSLGLTASMRIQAEHSARQLNLIKHQHNEVTLSDIMQTQFPHLSSEEIHQLTEEELSAEMEICFAYPYVIDLIRAAHQRGIKIIIVSDTYFTEEQLRRLLVKLLPLDIMSAITKIFCSCEYKLSKSNGLFSAVIKSMEYQPEYYLHLGDNITSDFTAARACRMHAFQFHREDEYINHVLRLQAMTAAIMNPAMRVTQALYSPFLGMFAAEKISADKAETLIGYVSLGQIMYAFARFICDQVNEITKQGIQPKVVFLMRDAYLPSLACEALMGSAIGTRIRISRFAANAASFRSEDDVDKYLSNVVDSQRFQDMTRQLLLPDKVAEPLIKTALKSAQPMQEFIKLIHRSDILRIIFSRSEDYRERLLRHLKNTAEISAGDTVVFVDLGYHGTVQEKLTPILAEMNITVKGLYLIALRKPGWEANRRGLIDPSWCDDKALKTLVSYVALLEQLCTSKEKSVIDYDKDGKAIFSETGISDQQHEQLFHIQTECVRFIQEAKHFYQHLSYDIPMTVLREIALSEIARMVFLPTESELNHLQHFQFDFNLGTNDVLQMFNPAQGLKGLHQRGIFYIEKQSKSMRMNYPAELRSASFELTMALLAQQRFALDIKLKDMLTRQELLPIVLKRGQETHHTTMESLATYDGYYSAWTPASIGNINIAVILGKNHEWIQIESAELVQLEAFIEQKESQHILDVWPCLTFENMAEKGDRLFECSSENSTMIFQPNIKPDNTQYIFRFTYRPVIKRIKKGIS